MNFKSISTYAYFLTLAFPSSYVFSEEAPDFFDDISITGDSFKNMDSDDLDSMISDISADDLTQMRSCVAGDSLSWIAIFKEFKVDAALNEPLYKKTSVPVSRNLINYPNIQLCTYQPIDGQQFTTHLFYNQTSKKDFAATCDKQDGRRISSYLNIENKPLLTALDKAFESPIMPASIKTMFKNIDMPKLVATIGNARLEERRVGMIGHFTHKYDNQAYFEAKLPIMWMIRNINFTQAEKDIIQKELSFLQGSSGASFDEDAFSKQHFIFDSFGIGTLELSLCKKMWEGNNWSIDIGGGLLLPTDHAFKRGLYGTYIDPKDSQPTLKFCDIVNFNQQKLVDGGIDRLEKYFFDALDQFSSIVLQCPLGYNKHMGFDIKVAPFWQIKQDLSFNALYNLELFLPQEQTKFFVPINSTVFTDQLSAMPQATEEEQQAKLAFMQDRITTLFYPRVINVKMFPGVIFSSVSSLQKTFKHWDFTLGYSGWWQSSEKIVGMCPAKDLNLDIAKALNPSLYSVKLFGKIHKDIDSKRHGDISLSLWADSTVFNHGVGNDFSLGFSFDSKF